MERELLALGHDESTEGIHAAMREGLFAPESAPRCGVLERNTKGYETLKRERELYALGRDESAEGIHAALRQVLFLRGN